MTLIPASVTDIVALSEYRDSKDFATSTDFSTAVVGNLSYFTEVNATLTERCKWKALNTVIAILLVFTFILNAASSFVLFRVPLVTIRGRSNPVYFCIRFLNICDVLQAFFLAVMPAFATNDCGWLGGTISCKVMGFFVLFFLLVSPLITILMAFDRVVALYQPFKYRSNLGLKMLKISLPSACILVLVTTILPIFGVGEYHVVKGRRFCLLDTITEDPVDRSYVIAVHVIFLLALSFMLSCTIAFQFKLARMSFTKKHKEAKSKTRKKVSSRRTRNATFTTMGVCGIFILCYMPYVIRVLVEAVRVEKSPSSITWFTFGLAFLQPLLNPIVYIGTNARYRKELISLIKNINISEWDTSSESGTTLHGSNGAFSGFYRRLTSRGSRNSRRGSKRKNNNGSRTSVNYQSNTLPQAHCADGSGTEKRASWKRRSKQFTSALENGFKAEKSATTKTAIQLAYADEPHQPREASSSSGVRSCDSVDKTVFTSPSVTASLTFRLSGVPSRYFQYGRSLRRDSGLPDPTYRKRSYTVSGGEKSKAEVENESTLHCASTPTLVASKDLLADPQVENDNKESDAEVMSIHLLSGTPQSSPTKTCQDSPTVVVSWPHTLPKVKRWAEDDSENDTDIFHSAREAPSPNGKNSLSSLEDCSRLNRAQYRPSYKRALNTALPSPATRKPSQRDSGVGDS